MHVDAGEQVHHVGRVFDGDPVELAVLPRREVAEAAAAAFVGATLAAVELAGDAGQGTQLLRAQLAIRHGDAQHGRVALYVPAVLQPQGPKLLLAERASEAAAELVTELCGALVYEASVEVVVSVHVGK
jgi:hypothetical protein